MNDRTNGDPSRRSPYRGRRKTRTEERIEGLDTSRASLASEVTELKERLESAEREAAENRTGWQRAAADLSNYRRRTEQEREDYLGLASESLLRKVLAVADDFDRAMAQMPAELTGLGWTEGIWAIDRKLRQLLASEGLTPIEAEGLPFDPHLHEAIAHQESTTVQDGTVVAEIQKGYRIRDRVLRPSMVTVAKNESGADQTSTPIGNDEGRQAKEEALEQE